MKRIRTALLGVAFLSSCGSAGSTKRSQVSSNNPAKPAKENDEQVTVGPQELIRATNSSATETRKSGTWLLRDAGGGGAVSALIVGPYIYNPTDGSYSNVGGDLLVGSDMSGIYALPAGATDFVARHNGLTYTKMTPEGSNNGLLTARGSSLHVQGIDIAPAPDNLVVATTQGGVIYRSADRGAHWQPVFDVSRDNDIALFKTKEKKIFFGPVAIATTGDTGSRTVVVGIGQPKHLKRGKEKASKGGGLLKFLPDELKFKVLVSEDSGLTWNKVDLCKNNCPNGKMDVGHVVSITATSNKKQFWVATLGGLFLLTKEKGGWAAANKSRGTAAKPYSWGVLSVQPNAKNSDDVLVLSADDADNGLLWQSTNANDKDIQWTNVTGNLGKDLPAVSLYGPFVKLLRSRSRPSEAVVTGTKNDSHGVWFTRDFSKDEWTHVLHNEMVGEFAADAWTRYDIARTNLFKGVSEVTIAEDAHGIREIYTAGFLGMLVRSKRIDDSSTFESKQIFSRQVSENPEMPRYKGAGEISLGSSKGGVLIDRSGRGLAAFLYGDNGLFMTADNGSTFSRPVKDWFFGTGGMIFGSRVAISYTKGNHLESVANGGIQYSSNAGDTFTSLNTEGLPKTVFTEVMLSRTNTDLFGLLPGCGIFRFKISGESEGVWSSFSEGLPEESGRGEHCGDGYKNRNITFLREGLVGGQQVLLAAVKNDKSGSVQLFYRIPFNPAAKWKRVALNIHGQTRDSLRENISEIRFQDAKVVILTGENQVLVGNVLWKVTPEAGIQFHFADAIAAPSKKLPDLTKKMRTVSIEIADVTLCKGTLYAATADGVWYYNSDERTWRTMPLMPFKSVWTIEADSACGLYAGAKGAGNYYLAPAGSAAE